MGAPGLVLGGGGHEEAAVVGHAALALRVGYARLWREAVAAAGPVALVVAGRNHVGHLGHERLHLRVEPACRPAQAGIHATRSRSAHAQPSAKWLHRHLEPHLSHCETWPRA